MEYGYSEEEIIAALLGQQGFQGDFQGQGGYGNPYGQHYAAQAQEQEYMYQLLMQQQQQEQQMLLEQYLMQQREQEELLMYEYLYRQQAAQEANVKHGEQQGDFFNTYQSQQEEQARYAQQMQDEMLYEQMRQQQNAQFAQGQPQFGQGPLPSSQRQQGFPQAFPEQTALRSHMFTSPHQTPSSAMSAENNVSAMDIWRRTKMTRIDKKM